jgi:hypothetical protein
LPSSGTVRGPAIVAAQLVWTIGQNGVQYALVWLMARQRASGHN